MEEVRAHSSSVVAMHVKAHVEKHLLFHLCELLTANVDTHLISGMTHKPVTLKVELNFISKMILSFLMFFHSPYLLVS